jgi:hypothetical protein
MSSLLVAALLLQATPALENDYVRVSRDAAPCASATARCGDRVVVALSPVSLTSRGAVRKLVRGDIAVFKAGQSYETPKGGSFFEVAIKPNHPAVKATGALVPPAKNAILHQGEDFFVFEERLAVGDTRATHGHRERVVIQLNRTRLQQWPEGEPELIRDIEPDRAGFNPPVVHTVKNVGPLPLRGIVIEFKARKRAP